ncbi:MAG: hypothetical protein GC145_18540 [Caulobacter sp.]|nr:hypothetical protein [Caulobacter sp.]
MADAEQDQISIRIGGKIFTGWKTFTVSVGIDALVGHFQIALSERWPGDPDQWGIEAGDACQLFIGEDKVITGWVDVAEYALDAERHPLTVSGMEKTIDLTDCSAIHKPGSWKGRKLEQIAADLTAPFSIGVKAVASTGAVFATFALQQGEKVFEAIDRMARQRGVLPVTTAEGDLQLIVPGQQAAGYSLELGQTIEAITFTNSLGERFSDYVLKGYSADGATRPKATEKDGGLGRYRPLLIVNDDHSTPANLAARARHEATTRAGRGQQVQITVSGFRDGGGELYRADRRVPVKARAVGIEAELLIYAVTYRRDETGSRTELMLAPKEAFGQLAIPAPAKRRRKSTPPLASLGEF